MTKARLMEIVHNRTKNAKDTQHRHMTAGGGSHHNLEAVLIPVIGLVLMGAGAAYRYLRGPGSDSKDAGDTVAGARRLPLPPGSLFEEQSYTAPALQHVIIPNAVSKGPKHVRWASKSKFNP